MNIEKDAEFNSENHLENNVEISPPKTEEKEIKIKRNPFEKLIDDSILICDDLLIKKEDDIQIYTDKFIKTIEKEIMKKEEFYQLFQLYEKAKKIKYIQEESQVPDIKDSFTLFKSDLINIKSTYVSKRVQQRNPKEDADENNNLSSIKKRKVNNKKKDNHIVDTTEIIKKIEDIEIKNTKDTLASESFTPKKEENLFEDKCVKMEDHVMESESKNKIEIGKKTKEKNSDKKEKAQKDNGNKTLFNFFPKKFTPSSTVSNFKENFSDLSIKKENGNLISNFTEVNKKDNNDDNIIAGIIISYDNQTSNDVQSAIIKNNNKIEEELPFIIHRVSKNIVTLDYNEEIIKLKGELSKTSTIFYNIKGKDLAHLSEYQEAFKNYIQEVSLRIKTAYKDNPKKKKKVIFIHNSYITHKSKIKLFILELPETASNLINPRNPFKKDDFIIDYDRDSEEEFLEENAEDIKSNDNSIEEEENEEEDEEGKWIVPDGHLSEDEISIKEEGLQDANQKLRTIMDIMEIRKNYPKPVEINFNTTVLDNKVKMLKDIFTARIFNVKGNEPLDNNIEANPNIEKFPIKILSKVTEEPNKPGITINLKDRLDDVVREIHYSYMTKDYLIKIINEKYPNISKKSLANFFRENVLSMKCKTTFKKRWIIKKEIIDSLNLSIAEINEIIERQNNILEEKEKMKKLELELNEQNNEHVVIDPNVMNQNNRNSNPNILDKGDLYKSINSAKINLSNITFNQFNIANSINYVQDNEFSNNKNSTNTLMEKIMKSSKKKVKVCSEKQFKSKSKHKDVHSKKKPEVQVKRFDLNKIDLSNINSTK